MIETGIMPVTFDGKLVIAISSRALFNLSDSHRVYLEEGLEAFQDYQVQHEDDLLEPGDAFPLVQKLLAINDLEQGKGRVEVILLSRNRSDTGLRVFNSIAHYRLPITRAAFASGESPHRYVSAFGAHLFLSTDPGDVQQVLEAGYAAATILSGGQCQRPDGILRIAFDGDAVLFSDESEQIFQNDGLEAFTENERQSARQPLDGGPFKPFLAALHQLQNSFPVADCPIRTALVTARGAPAHERVVRTLRDWDIRLDESLFLGGLSKGEFLRAFGADVFFDDQQGHCESAAEHVAAGHVPHGISNKKKDSTPV